MAEPTKKSPEIESFLNNMFGDRVSAIKSDTCVVCGEAAVNFRDSLSQKEFTISGMCQSCQDDTFAINEEDDYQSGPEDFEPDLEALADEYTEEDN